MSHEFTKTVGPIAVCIIAAEEATPAELESLLRKSARTWTNLIHWRKKCFCIRAQTQTPPRPKWHWFRCRWKAGLECGGREIETAPPTHQRAGGGESKVADAACEPKYMARAVQNLVQCAPDSPNRAREVSALKRTASAIDHSLMTTMAPVSGGRPCAFSFHLRASKQPRRATTMLAARFDWPLCNALQKWQWWARDDFNFGLGGARITIEWPSLKAIYTTALLTTFRVATSFSACGTSANEYLAQMRA